MPNYFVLPFSTAAARDNERLPVGFARSVAVVSAPLDVAAELRIGSGTADAIPIGRGSVVTIPDGASTLWLTTAATATGADLVLLVSPDLNGAASVVNSGVSLVAIADGDVAGLGAQADAAVSDPAAAGSLIALTKGLLTLMGATGNPDIADVVCTLAATNYDHDANTALGRNARAGTIRSAEANAGTVSFAVSHNGLTFSGWWTLAPGDTYALDGLDVDTVRVKSSSAGDTVNLELH